MTSPHGTGAPARDHGSYAQYLQLDKLLSLQACITSGAGEPLFLIMHQVAELTLKLLVGEIDRLQRHVEQGDLLDAITQVGRAQRVHGVLRETWEVLGTLSPAEFGAFRGALGSASGAQSVTYRELMSRLGERDHTFLLRGGVPAAEARRLRELQSRPSLYDAVLEQLHKGGVPLPDRCLDRDWSEPYEEHPDVVDAWREVYQNRREHQSLFDLAEALIELSYGFCRWRAVHALVAERLIGAKVGTGGTSGVSWLQRRVQRREFPELWTVRTLL